MSALSLLAFLLFPTGRLLSSRWRIALAFPALVAAGFATRGLVPGPLGFLGVANPVGAAWLPSLGDYAAAGGVPLLLGSIVAAAEIRARFRAALPVEREQIKWLAVPLAVLLFAVALTFGVFLAGVPADEGVNSAPLTALYGIAQLAIPICMAIAIVRYRLFDIDVLINRAAVYGVTTALVAVSFFVAIVVLQAVLRPITSGSEVAVVISTLAGIALFQPLRRRMQATVDRRFYRSRYDAARTLDDFSARLRDEVDLDAVRAGLVNAVRDTVQPAHASLWLRPE